MNELLPKPFLLLLLSWGFPLLLSAQQVVTDTIFEEQTFEYSFVSQPNPPDLMEAPENGTVSWTETTQFNYELVYTPDDGFIGQDSMRFLFWNSAFSYTFVKFRITVAPSLVTAVHDYATTTVGQPVDIDVLANDYSSNGVLNLTSVPLTNYGTATYNLGDSTVNFVPAPGFEGLAYLNYVVCDDIGTCDNGTVSVFVVSSDPPQPDTTRLFTRKNTPQVVFVPPSYTLVAGPTNGLYDDSGEVPEYTPDADYVGKDYIAYDNNGTAKVIEMVVLDLVNNKFAFDDYFYLTPDVPTTELNVFTNDEFGVNTGCWYASNVSDAQYGTVEFFAGDAAGVIRYTPPPGFVGVDWFTYTSCPPGGNAGQVETATAYVFVSNYEPDGTEFYMSTPKLTPLVVGYSVPIDDFSFDVTADPDLGTVAFLPGPVDTVIYGQTVTGYNLILYTPDADVVDGQDNFELEYCVTTNGLCTYQKTVKIYVDILDIGDGTAPMCIDDCIWAGDTNADGVVDMEDLLPIGLSMGEVGIPRTDANLSLWYGQYGEDWSASGNLYDLKHLDTDGDSVVTALDTFAISAFYGNTHAIVPSQVPFYDYQIILEGDIFAGPGDLVKLKMKLGTDVDPASNVYGLTFPFNYDPNTVNPASVDIDFTTGSWLAYNSPVLHMSNNNLNGLLESGFTRTNGIPASGYGQMAIISFIISEDLEGFRADEETLRLNVGGGTSTVMDGSGHTFGVNIGNANITIRPHQEDAPITEAQLKLFPNPTNGQFINLHLNGGNEFERALVYDLTGRLLSDTGRMMGRRAQLSVGQLTNGVYVVQVYTKQGVLTKKFEIIR